MRKRKEPLFTKEADLCAAFIAWARGEGWTSYPETAGWDILLVAGDGTQIGVQAKLRLNLEVLCQTLEGTTMYAWRAEGPDYRAILVPEERSGAMGLCLALGIQVFRVGLGNQFIPGIRTMEHYSAGWHYWNPTTRCKLPEYVPDVVAGAPAPLQLTEWKIKALRICALLELRGYVIRHDFSFRGLDHRRWTGPGGWLIAGSVPGRFVAKPGARLFGPDHPIVYATILEEIRVELEASPVLRDPQPAVLI